MIDEYPLTLNHKRDGLAKAHLAQPMITRKPTSQLSSAELDLIQDNSMLWTSHYLSIEFTCWLLLEDHDRFTYKCFSTSTMGKNSRVLGSSVSFGRTGERQRYRTPRRDDKCQLCFIRNMIVVVKYLICPQPAQFLPCRP